MTIRKITCVLLMLSITFGSAYGAGDLASKFSYKGSISNTRHNLTQRQSSGGPAGTIMDNYRNDYGEVCVYCHTPHGASSKVTLPLWNRTIKDTTYTTYNELGTSTLQGTVSQPGNNSLACLSCHDGQTAVDSIINMPGSGGYLKAQEYSQSEDFLKTWVNPRGQSASVHLGLNQNECLVCHSPTSSVVGAGAADFSIAAIGTDLRNDHPVGVVFPEKTGTGTDFNTPSKKQGAAWFFDRNSNGRMDSGDVRLYVSGDKPQVECASCHDPHGVPSAGRDSAFFPTFLRMSNSDSALCMTCHAK